MSGAEADPTQSTDLLCYDREPVHFANSIQPHGILLGLSQTDFKILQVSANTEAHLGMLPSQLLGQPLHSRLPVQQIVAIQEGLRKNGNLPVSFELTVHTPAGDRPFDGRVHQTETGIILELEPIQAAPASPASFQVVSLQQVRQITARLKSVSGLSAFLQLLTEEIRDMTGFDRVMVYQFDQQGAGAVVAEAKREDLSPYLGLHYPATDIPEPTRALYQQGFLRYIPDLTAPSEAVIFSEPVVSQQAIDLRQAILRSVDPCCVQYHQNMNVAALLVISLVKDQRLWGLISCHHQTPKLLASQVRAACELVGEFTASALSSQVDHAELDAVLRLKLLQSEFIEAIAQATDLRSALVNPAPRLLDLVNATGAAVCLEAEITLVGVTPTIEQIHRLLSWAEKQPNQPLFHTNSLPKLYPDATEFSATGSGLLVLRISQVQRYSIVWFRPEVLQTVNWAGDPNLSMQVDSDGQVVRCPRQSFEQWQETVRCTALPWQAYELESALDLRQAIVGIVLHKADELAKINQELERSNQELDSFAYAASHDLKEPLRGIHNYSTLLLKGYSHVLDETGNNRLRTLLRLTRRMEVLIDVLLKFSRLGQAELHVYPTDLNVLVNQVLVDLQVNRQGLDLDIRIPRALPIVDCDPVLIQEVFMNLMTNAIKYTDQTQPWIEIGYLETDQLPVTAPIDRHRPTATTLYVRDNGIGIRDRHLQTVFRLFKRLHEQHLYGGGTGAGLTIAKKIIERHGGRIWVESVYGEGSTFNFTLLASR